jgi:L-2-hydroxyglutarate oxidase LhgO
MEQDALNEGIRFKYGVAYRGKKKNGINTSAGALDAGYVVNAAGLHADRIARQFGFSQSYSILPFKGLYLYSDEPPGSIRTNIYPVPNLRNPFLGVHFTVTVDGRVKIGPTAIPAFWREQYRGFDNFSFSEFLDISMREIGLFTHSRFDFMKLAIEEIRKYSRPHLVSLASQLVKDISMDNYKNWGKPGIRAQLVNNKEKKLEMDFVVESDDKSMHVLNAVSPGFTCCIPFSRFVCDEIESRLH